MNKKASPQTLTDAPTEADALLANAPLANAPLADRPTSAEAQRQVAQPREVGGRDGLDPTRFGDWEVRGRCIDF